MTDQQCLGVWNREDEVPLMGHTQGPWRGKLGGTNGGPVGTPNKVARVPRGRQGPVKRSEAC